jgi:hypothetical protein
MRWNSAATRKTCGRYETLAHALGEQAAAVPALIFCGEMHVGWGGDEVTGADPPARLDDCRARAGGVGGGTGRPTRNLRPLPQSTCR